MTPPLWQKVKPLDESQRGERKSWLKAQHSENEDHGIRSRKYMGKQRKQWLTLFFGLQNHCRLSAAMKLKDAYSLEEKL